MTKKYSTKKALVASILSLMLCFTMLLGTTFAWFTDSVTSAGNIIQSGELDVAMNWAEGQNDPTAANTVWTDASKGAIFNYANWEPGYVMARHIRITNEGSLALKYIVKIVANGDVSDLANVIDVYYLDPAEQIDRADLTEDNKLGTLTQVLANLADTAYGELAAGEKHEVTLALKMQETAGNEYMNKKIGDSFSVQLLATQLAAEPDSFDKLYDKDAEFPKMTYNASNADEFKAASKNAGAGDIINLMSDITLSEAITLPAGVVLNGNGKQINGTIYAGGDLTFEGHTKVTSFSASYYNRTITIGEGACLEITGTGRMSLAYGNVFNITGTLTDAKNTDKATVQPSLIIPAGISITGGNDAAMNVTNAYVQLGSTTSKPGAANGTFNMNFTNSIVDFTKELGLYEPTGGMNPTFNVNVKDSVLTTGAKLCIAASNSNVVIDNSTVTLGDYLRNSGTLTLKNGSALTGATIQFGENGGNNGTINVDNSTLTVTATSTGHAFDGKGIGSINLTNGATAKVDYYKAMTITTDATSTFTGTEVQ